MRFRARRAPRWPKAAAAAGAALASSAMAGSLALADVGDLKGTGPGDLALPGFEDADVCRNCHGGGVAGDASFLPSDTWAGTMMGNAARDPAFHAALTVANQDEPGIGTFCLRCHSPIGFVRGHATPADGSAFDAIDQQGVGCETCHRAAEAPAEVALGAPYLIANAQLYYDENTAKRGPRATIDSPAHLGVHQPSLGDSSFCGQCHQVTNPNRKLRDAAGVETELEFPLDTTFEEWANSSFGRDPASPSFASCASCHMRAAAGEKPATKLPGSPLRAGLRDHAFVGGNAWGIRAVMHAFPDRATKYAKAFELALARTQEMLESAVELEASGFPKAAAEGDAVSLEVKVTNLSGHKFPTGYAETRRAWVAVAIAPGSAGGGETFVIGGYDPVTGEVQAEPPTRVYQAVHGAWNGSLGEPESHLVKHDMILRDSRIPPRGFAATAATRPVGELSFVDGGGNGGGGGGGAPAYLDHDRAELGFVVPAGLTGVRTVSVRVYYQSMTPEYVEFLREANTTDSNGEALAAAFEATDRGAPVEIARVDAPVDFGGGPGAGGAAEAGSGGGGGGAGAGAGGEGGGGAGGASDPGCGCRVVGARAAALDLDARAGWPDADAAWLTAFFAFAAARRRSRPR